jgi:hypothetical protein
MRGRDENVALRLGAAGLRPQAARTSAACAFTCLSRPSLSIEAQEYVCGRLALALECEAGTNTTSASAAARR